MPPSTKPYKRPKLTGFSARAEQFANDVISGKLPNCKWVVLACKRFLADLDRIPGDWPYFFDQDAAAHACEFIETLPHVKGNRWAGKKFLLRDWQCFIVCNLFGWRKKRNGYRRFRKAYLLIPRKNGKSPLAAAIGLYCWCMDGEAGAEVYSGATTEKQAWEVFRPAKRMLEETPDLLDFVGKNAVHAKGMVIERDLSRFEPVIGKPGDGASPSCGIVDEYHEHDTPDLVDTFTTGMIGREQPLLMMISTAGYNLAGPCYDQQLDAQHVLEGVLDDEEIFCLMFGIDEEDDWADPKVLPKANPNFDVSVDADILLAEQRQAVLNPLHQNRFRTKHLNVWCSARFAWMPMQQWHLCAEQGLKIEEFEGQPCIAVLDLASKDDLAAYGKFFFKKINNELHGYAFIKYYIPEDIVREGLSPNAPMYRKWAAMGLITMTDGAEIDFDVIHDDVVHDKSKYPFIEIAYDPWRATHLALQLAKKGAVVVEMRQTVQNLSAPMKEVLSAVKGCRLHHDGNQVTSWMVSNVTAKVDAKDNIYPRKEKPQMKIDGAVVIIMGWARGILERKAGIGGWLKKGVVSA